MKRGPVTNSGSGASSASVAKAWGVDAPDWVLMLARMCDKTSQAAVGKQINYSGTTVNQVLSNSYAADMGAIEKAVKGVFMGLLVQCPELGPITADRCVEHQRLAIRFMASSSFRVRMYRACRACPLSRFTTTEEGEPQ